VNGRGSSYITLNSDGYPELGTDQLSCYDREILFKSWIPNATGHSHQEKRFVDAIVARNPNVIDLEVGLPAADTIERVAPRIDLAVLEPSVDGWRIAFWEAKLAGDGRARCSVPAVPKCKPDVLKQLGQYTDWLRRGRNCDDVVRAYQNSCRLFVAFHAKARCFNANIAELGEGIRAVAGGALVVIDDEPRLLIDNRRPNVSFTKNGHLEKLRKAGLHVQMVHGADQMTLEVIT
jgi:hypothetical protein